MAVIGQLIRYTLFLFAIPFFLIYSIMYSGYGIVILTVTPVLTFLLNKHIGRKTTIYSISILSILTGAILGYYFIISTIAEISYPCKAAICTVRDAVLFGAGMGITASLLGALGLFIGLTFSKKK